MRRTCYPSGRGLRELVSLKLTDHEFHTRFGTEELCRDFLFRSKWPGGFHCDRCDGSNLRWISSKRLRCTRCRKPHSLTSGTILQNTRRPLRDWFYALHVMVQPGGNASVLM